MKKPYLILLAIIVLGAVLRLWMLGQVPQSPDWDEAAYGYNALSILQTGKDEYGKVLPIVLRSFNDYKPALYLYFVIPFVKLLGPSLIAIRLPSALFGILSIVILFFIVKELCGKMSLALMTAFLLAIMPWHIQFSRVAFEANVGLACNLLMVWCFLKAQKKPFWLLFAGVLAGLNVYVYQSEKIISPLLFGFLLILYGYPIFRKARYCIILAVTFAFLIALPMLSYLGTTPAALARAKGTSIFTQNTGLLKTTITRVADDTIRHDTIGLVMDNRRVVYLKTLLGGYLSHFSLNWLFITGDNPRHHPPFFGELYLWMAPFLLIGLYRLFFRKPVVLRKRDTVFLIIWLLLAPLASSVTFEAPHAVRAINMLPSLTILIALGLMTSYEFIERTIVLPAFRYTVISIFSLVCLLFFSYYLDQYFVQLNYFNAPDWQYGYQQTVSETGGLAKHYKKVVVSDQKAMQQSYIFFLYYLRYPPKQYQADETKSPDSPTKSFGKYEFRKFDWEKEKETTGTLFIGTKQDFPDDIKTLSTVSYPDGTVAFKIVSGAQ